MPIACLAPLDETITIEELTRDPYPIYRRLRREAPVLRVKSVGRTFLTKAADTKYVKDNAALFSSDDPNTPMKRAFLAHTLMRKDHDEHRTERMAMMPALMPKTIESVWAPLYAKLAAAYLDRLPRGEVVDLFSGLAGPLAARFIPKGDTVMTIQASANRDEDVFDDGENYYGLREPNPHQAFGNGPHHCAGAHLSRRTVGAILLPMLFERFPNMTLPDPSGVRWHGFGFRGPLNLPILLQ